MSTKILSVNRQRAHQRWQAHVESSGTVDVKEDAKAHYFIVEDMGEGFASVWDVELPTSIFAPYEDEGWVALGKAKEALRCVESHLSKPTNMMPAVRSDYARLFYSKYVNHWDYLHHTANGGEAWEQFVLECAMELSTEPRPATILKVPCSHLISYILFLHSLAAETYDADVKTFVYDVERALNEFIESMESMKRRMSR